MRIIPRKTKVKIEFYRNISLVDILIGLVGFGLEGLLLMTNFGIIKFVLMTFILGLFICLFLPVDGVKAYEELVIFIKYLVSSKKYETNAKDAKQDINQILPFTKVDGDFIDYGEYVGGVMEIKPTEFRLLSEYKQNEIIEKTFASIIKSIAGKTNASLVKIDRPIIFDEYIEKEKVKKDILDKIVDSNGMTFEESLPRKYIIDDRTEILKRLNTTNKINKYCYYLVVYDSHKKVVNEVLNNAQLKFAEHSIKCDRLVDKDLVVFLKYNYTNDFDERDIKYLSPEEYNTFFKPESVEFKSGKTIIDGKECFITTIKDYPLTVKNAWGFRIFNIPNTKVVMNFQPIEKSVAIKRIDKSLQELLAKQHNTFKASDVIDGQTHIETLVNLLTKLQNDNETLFETTIHIVVYNNDNDAKNSVQKKVRTIVSENGFKLSDNYFKQKEAFIASNLSSYDGLKQHYRSIHSSSLAATFPFVLNYIMDDQGVLLGQANGFPVICDFFKRDKERVNSNVVIMGKSGSGKSFATKTLLANLASENCKIFILDPENEYNTLAKNLGGKLIDVGSAKEGRLNPFHIITTLESDEEEGEDTSFSMHLQFLEEFFKQILVGISSDALEYLNNMVLKMYKSFNIDANTQFNKLSPKDYPTFDNLLSIIKKEQESAVNEYDIANLRILTNYISKFAGNGRNANLWNGENTLSVQENFTVFNFQSLLANKNNTVANAQMLLVLKWLDNEIIKNRDFNLKHGTDRKIIVVIDEAHVFIDTKYPIALDFMFQLAKRIRKYNGMQIVITQNIKDFVGSQEIARKSTAIINACQYSLIFALSPNDMDDLCVLYDKAGQINKVEQQDIINNDRGSAFMITGPLSRTNISIVASNLVENTFGENSSK